MNNNTERLAREWAEYIKSETSLIRTQEVHAAAEYILATTTPPTMADVEWDDEKHRLAGATTPTGRDLVMMWNKESPDQIVTEVGAWERELLTPNGKRYKLVEIGKPEHPEVLTTVEDYENAPTGTVVANRGFFPLVKKEPNCWLDPFHTMHHDRGLAGASRKVLRWGWGE